MSRVCRVQNSKHRHSLEHIFCFISFPGLELYSELRECLFQPPKPNSNVDGNFWGESGCTVLSERGLCPRGLILNSPCLDSILKSNSH